MSKDPVAVATLWVAVLDGTMAVAEAETMEQALAALQEAGEVQTPERLEPA